MSVSSHPNHEVKGNRPPGKGRGASNTNDRGNTDARRARKAWLVSAYPADQSLIRVTWNDGDQDVGTPQRWGFYDLESIQHYADQGMDIQRVEVLPTCRCYRCGRLLTIETVTVDKIFTKPEGGTYRTPVQDRREKATNIRPACNDCNSRTGAALASQTKKRAQ